VSLRPATLVPRTLSRGLTSSRSAFLAQLAASRGAGMAGAAADPGATAQALNVLGMLAARAGDSATPR
jgi:hypothetical protein